MAEIWQNTDDDVLLHSFPAYRLLHPITLPDLASHDPWQPPWRSRSNGLVQHTGQARELNGTYGAFDRLRIRGDPRDRKSDLQKGAHRWIDVITVRS